MIHTIPKENYLANPGNESCYEYLLNCYKKISADLGGDYTAFVTPVANVETETSMQRFIADIEKLAAWFVSKGLGKGDVITAFLPTCGHAAVVMYATSKIGAIANYVHPLTPPEQLLDNLKYTNSKCVVMLDLFAARYKAVCDEYLTVVGSVSDFCDGTAYKYAKGNELQNGAYERGENHTPYMEIINANLPAVPTNKDPGTDDAFYINGGGTTGKSKTIIHTAYSFNNLAYAMYALDKPHDYSNSYSLCVLPCFHVYGLGLAIHYSICNAYRPILMSKFDAVQANELIRKYCVLAINGAPNMFIKLSEAANFDNNEGIKNLLILAVGGDYVNPEFIKSFNARIAAQGSKALLAPGYGLTEMCAVCTSNALPEKYYRIDTVGMPVLDSVVEIWDENCNKLPIGEIGEVVITGKCMMKGYLPDENIKETGIYIDENGTKWIRSGDVGYLTEDGHLKFTSRIKRIIIISGYNVYPATIEKKVLELDYVSEVCACQGYDENGKPYVKLVVSPADKQADHEELKEKLMAYCKANIEGYGCPRKIFVMDALPRTKMEKIDFVALSDKVPS